MLLLHTLKFISSPFLSLFSAIILKFSSSFSHLYRDDTGKATVEINICRSCQSVSESRVLKSTGKSDGFFVILHNKLTNRRGKMSGTVRV